MRTAAVDSQTTEEPLRGEGDDGTSDQDGDPSDPVPLSAQNSLHRGGSARTGPNTPSGKCPCSLALTVASPYSSGRATLIG